MKFISSESDGLWEGFKQLTIQKSNNCWLETVPLVVGGQRHWSVNRLGNLMLL